MFTLSRRAQASIDRVWEAYWQSGKGKSLRDQIVEHYYSLVRPFVLRFGRRLPRGADFDVLESAAAQGLVEAVERFDRQKGDDFPRYAELVMRSRILNELRRRDASAARQIALEARREEARESLSQELGRKPSEEELQAHLGRQSQDSGSSHPACPNQRGRDGAARLRGLPSHWASEVHRALSPRVKAILYLHFSEEVSQTEIAEVLGISRVRVSQLIREALGRLTS